MQENINKILKYSAVWASTYLVLRFVPKVEFDDSNLVLLSTIVTVVFYIIEHLSDNIIEEKKKEGMTSICMSKCKSPRLEHLDNVATEQVQPLAQSEQPANKLSDDDLQKLASMMKVMTEQSKALFDEENKKREDIEKKIADSDPQNSSTYSTSEKSQYDAVNKVMDGVERTGSRAEDGVITHEEKYNNYVPAPAVFDPNMSHHHIPLPDNYNTGSFEYGYSFLPPEKWYPQPPVPPVCVAEKKCPVCPIYTNGTELGLKEWNDARRISAPDNINVDYVKEKLNSGR